MENDKLNIARIDKNIDPDSPLNFDALRAKGIELVQELSGHAWSDFNLHDPGVTILEHLSFAITDMAYRTHFDLRDLLADAEGNINAKRNLFYSRREILASNPVTVNDLRKLILDTVPEVYNVWLEKVYSNQSSGYIKGLYKVVIQVFDENEEYAEPLTDDQVKARRILLEEDVTARVQNVVLDHRNLGEDYVDFFILKPCIIEVEADIVIDRHVNGEEVLAEVYAVIQHTLNPAIHFYSESDLLAKGFTLEEMYSGPALAHGFLLDAELDPRVKAMDPADLKKSTRARIVDPADILKAIATIPGVLYVRDFDVKSNGEYQHIPFRLRVDEYASFSYQKEERDIKLSNENNELQVKESLFYSILNKKSDFAQRKFIKGLHQSDDASVLKGNYQNVENYFSFQYLFPPVYGLNLDKIDVAQPRHRVNDERLIEAKAKAKQLKAYLMFFEQVLANYLSQLGNIDRLITADTDEASSTYFTQPLYQVPGAGNILKDFYRDEPEQTEVYWDKFKSNPDNSYVSFLQSQIETDDTFKARKSRILDHLMSRFNLNLKKYPVVFFSQSFHPHAVDQKVNAELVWKSEFLKDIVTLSRNRNRAYNYRSGDAATQASGFETLMCRLLYIQNTTKRKLSNTFDQYMNRFSLLERDFYVTRSDKKMTSVPLEWSKGTKIELLISEDELQELLNQSTEEKQKETEIKGLLFPKQPISFLRDGLDPKNYRIGPDVNNKDFILIYKSPAEKKWIRAGRFDSWQSASDALHFLLDTLRQFNIESEGFHVIEHILLRPSLESKYFGFNFYDEKGHVLFYQNHWTDFQERETAVEQILAIADGDEPVDYAAMADVLNGKCRINHWQNDVLVKSYSAQTLYHSDPSLAKKLFDKILRNIKEFRKKRMTLYPGIENVVNRLHDTDIPEDFYHFRTTVVLPAWPTRFQDKGFRLFTENLFREYTPAHIKTQFKWLGIGKMKKFEALYFDWRETMLGDHKTADDIVKTDKLISFINDGIYSMM